MPPVLAPVAGGFSAWGLLPERALPRRVHFVIRLHLFLDLLSSGVGSDMAKEERGLLAPHIGQVVRSRIVNMRWGV